MTYQTCELTIQGDAFGLVVPCLLVALGWYRLRAHHEKEDLTIGGNGT